MATYSWVVGKFLLLLILLAVAIYLTVRVIERRGIAPRRSRRPPERPVGPDDDPDFLRDLDRRRPDGPDDSR